jgi:nucleotide-binding universal stress UspA family protein
MAIIQDQKAINDFKWARRKADIQGVLARLSGQPSELLSYDEVRRKLRAVEDSVATYQEIPLDAIVGSVGRYSDFNRMFMPLKDSDLPRWVGVSKLMNSLVGVPPIEVYQLGEVYFVKDGNHRVSVAKQLGAKYIAAYVTKVHTTVPVTKDLDYDNLIIKAEYAEFLDKTQLHRSRPEADLMVTVPGQYATLLEHIQVHQYFMGLDEQREVSFEEAAAHWYDTVYCPVVRLVTARGLLQDFPERTPTDLYLWLAHERAQLKEKLGWDLKPEAITDKVVQDLAKVSRSERAQQEDPHRYLLDDLLVAIPGTDIGWRALEQALLIAEREQARVYGLHVLPEGATPDARSEQIETLFHERCRSRGIEGQFALESGEVVSVIAQRARWVDMVVANLAYPPGVADARPSGGFGELLRQCPRPVLAVPGRVSQLSRALLAYDGSSRAEIALFAAAYLGAHWGIPLTVLIVKEGLRVTGKVVGRARSYLERHEIEATYVVKTGAVVAAILSTLQEQQADLLIIGSYEYNKFLEPILGGVLDDVLRESRAPMLICQ